MCCICSKLPLYLKCIRETHKHLVVWNAKLIEFFYFVFFYPEICQILCLYLLDFIRKLPDWSECMPTDKIGDYPTHKRQYGWDYKTVSFIVSLIIVHLQRKVIYKLIPLILRNADIYFILIIIFPGINSLLQGIDIMHTIFIDKHCQAATYNSNI